MLTYRRLPISPRVDAMHPQLMLRLLVSDQKAATGVDRPDRQKPTVQRHVLNVSAKAN